MWHTVRAGFGGSDLMCISHQRLTVFSVLAICLLCSSCSRDPGVRKQKYLHSGQQYFEKGKYREAAIEFVNALKIDPNDAAGHYRLAETYLRLQKPDTASQELARTLELQPENFQARLELTNLLILGREFSQAQEQIDSLLRERSNDPAVHSTFSSLLAAQGDLSGALKEVQKAIALDPSRWGWYLELAMLQLSANQADAAEASLKKVIELNPTATQAHVLLGKFYQVSGRFTDAEQQLQTAVRMDPKDPEAQAALARLYLAEGKGTEAEKLLERAKHDFPNDSAEYRMLGDFYFMTGSLDKAIAEYSSLYQEHPQDIKVKKNYIHLLIQKNRMDEAGKLNDELLKRNPQDSDALIFRSEMQISNGDTKNATTTLQALIKNDPNNPDAHYCLGVALNKGGDLEGAENEWNEAVRLRPDLFDAQRSLAEAALRRGDMNRLAEVATQIVSLQPSSPEGYGLRALAEINRNQFASAETDVRKAIELAPQNSFGYVQLGNLKFAQKQYAAAAKAYQQGLDLNSNSRDALRGLMDSYLAQKQVDQAIAAAKTQIAKAPNNSAFYDLLGTMLFRSKRDLDGAEAALRQAILLDGSNPNPRIKLTQVQVAKGRVDQAIATCLQAIKDQPRTPDFYIMLGELYESKQQWNEAKNALQHARELRPDNPIAMRDLANVLLAGGGNLDEALALAQSAQHSMPDSPDAADTLGWIYYHKGAYPLALNLFQQALKLQQSRNLPESAEIHYHLGMTYEKTERPALARQHFDRALRIDPNYGAASDIKKQLDNLKS